MADETNNHAEREHSVWSASSTDRNVNCSGALALNINAPETTTEPADWGTVCHQIGEACLVNHREASEFIGQTLKGKKYEFEVDDEMADTAQEYVDYVLGRIRAYEKETGRKDALLFVEQKFSLVAMNPPFEAGGTADAVIYFPAWSLLEVIDLKGGRGVVVSAINNPQARSYGLGALLANNKLNVDRVMTTIVQPRAPHVAGRIRSETIDRVDMFEWTADLMHGMHRSKEAMDEYALVQKGEMPFASWWSKWLKAGGHCKFCPSAGWVERVYGPCPALEQQALDAAGVWFDDQDKPTIANTPDKMDPAKIAATLDLLDMLDDWINAVRSHAHTQAESGVVIPGYQLVEKIGRRAWTVGEEAVVKALTDAGVAADKTHTQKLVTPAQAEKLLGAKKKSAIAGMAEAPVKGTNLVASTKTTRTAVTPKVAQHFDVLD